MAAFGGATFDAERDENRLTRQKRDVWLFMKDGEWHTLPEISEATGHPEASISARLRDFRKPKFGSHTVQREYVERGLWQYRLIPNEAGVAVGMPVDDA